MDEHFGLLLTGVPGAGKTTVLWRVAARLTDRKILGFTTDEIREGRDRVGFRLRTLDGEEAVLAHVGIRSGPRVSRYAVEVAALDRIVDRRLRTRGVR